MDTVAQCSRQLVLPSGIGLAVSSPVSCACSSSFVYSAFTNFNPAASATSCGRRKLAPSRRQSLNGCSCEIVRGIPRRGLLLKNGDYGYRKSCYGRRSRVAARKPSHRDGSMNYCISHKWSIRFALREQDELRGINSCILRNEAKFHTFKAPVVSRISDLDRHALLPEAQCFRGTAVLEEEAEEEEEEIASGSFCPSLESVEDPGVRRIRAGAIGEYVEQSKGSNQGIFGKCEKYKNLSFLLAAPALAGFNVEGPQSVLQALGVLAAIITVHEAGHFMAARLQNIHVRQFAIGFGPTLAKFQREGVEYSLRAIPLGGFVAFPDDDPRSDFKPDDPDLLRNRSIVERSIVICAGVVANIVFAYSVLFVQVLGVGLLEQEFSPGVVVPEVINNSAAARAGVQAGDVVLSVDGYKFSAKEASVLDLVESIKKNPGKRLSFFVKRGSEVVSMDVIPEEATDGTGKIGVQLSPNAQPHKVRATNLGEAVVLSGKEFARLTITVVEGLKQVVFNFAQTADKLSGPVAIIAIGAEVARSDVAGLFQFAAIVNINLAVVNILPLPALDGGYLALIALEALRGGKKLPDGVEQGIMSSGILLLLALGVVLMVRDTLNLGFVQHML